MSWAYYSDPDRSIDVEQDIGDVFTAITETAQCPEKRTRYSNKREERNQLILPGFEYLMHRYLAHKPVDRNKGLLHS
jgi:hypothetical protein